MMMVTRVAREMMRGRMEAGLVKLVSVGGGEAEGPGVSWAVGDCVVVVLTSMVNCVELYTLNTELRQYTRLVQETAEI